MSKPTGRTTNLGKPTEETKPTGNSNKSGISTEGGGINISGEQKLGSTGGIDISGRVRLGTDGLIPKQGLGIEINTTNNSAKITGGLGSAKGKLGAQVGVEIGHDEYGNQEIKSAEVDVNIAGFGAGASVDDEGNVSVSGSVGGIKIEVAKGSDGSQTISLCYSIPGGEICVDFKKPTETPTPIPTPIPTPTFPNSNNPNNIATIQRCLGGDYELLCSEVPPGTGGSKEKIYRLLDALQARDSYNESFYNPEEDIAEANRRYGINKWIKSTISQKYIVYFGARWIYITSSNRSYIGSYGVISGGDAATERTQRIDSYTNKSGSLGFTSQAYNINTYIVSAQPAPKCPVPLPPPLTNKIQLPNHPQHIKPMNCCDKVEEIYKYLGIGKMKQRKFKLAKAFLVPKGQGNETCEDFYEIYENLIRMLANGLIINPISKPLGSDYQNANSTAWASEMYEMMAESMSNGDSTQRFEMHAASQMVQMMKTLAEVSSKVDFLMEAIGSLPVPKKGELPVLFTIHEAHKGFGKKEPKEIDVTKAKTDDDVEKILGKMFQPSVIPYTKYTFNPNSISILQALSKL